MMLMGMKCQPFAEAGETAVRLMIRYHYFVGLYYSMTLYDAGELPVPTLATNGVSMWINKDFWRQLNRDQRMTAIAHEMGHKMLLHSTRRGDRDHDVWNVAGDHVINLMLTESKFTPLAGLRIDGKAWSWCCDDKYAGWTTEKVYDDLMQKYEDEDEGGGGGGKGPEGSGERPSDTPGGRARKALGPMKDLVDFGRDPGGDSDETEGESGGKETSEQFEGRVRKELKDMAQKAKLAGNAPSWIERAVQNGEHVKVNWFDVLEQYIRGMHRADYSWSRWSRREFMKTGVLAPDMYQPALGNVLLYVDCSGSCWDALPKFNQHTQDIWQQMTPRKLLVRYFQTSVAHSYDQTFERGEGDVEMHQLGNGGTSFRWLADEIEAEEDQPELVLVLTDMYGDFGREVDGVPVLWLSVSSVDTAPFGEVININ